MSAENQNDDQAWLTSKEAKAKLRVSSCELMHLREARVLKFHKKGNAFLYARKDVQRRAHKCEPPLPPFGS